LQRVNTIRTAAKKKEKKITSSAKNIDMLVTADFADIRQLENAHANLRHRINASRPCQSSLAGM
jgi:hypothetical protein